MQVAVKLMGALKPKTPEGGKLDLNDGATISDALDILDIPPESIQVITINGTVERDRTKPISDGDELSVIAPVGGG